MANLHHLVILVIYIMSYEFEEVPSFSSLVFFETLLGANSRQFYFRAKPCFHKLCFASLYSSDHICFLLI